MGNKRLRLTDDQRRHLAVKGHALGRRVLAKIATIVTPDTILRWHHKLISMKWTFPGKRVGRPGLMKEIRMLIVRMATDNSSWGYSRIQGELKKLNHIVARSTVAKTLKDNGIPPCTGRTTTWSAFLKTHAEVIGATDFFTTEAGLLAVPSHTTSCSSSTMPREPCTSLVSRPLRTRRSWPRSHETSPITWTVFFATNST